jgi:hypothetical protein
VDDKVILSISNSTLDLLSQKKDQMGFKDQNWDSWFNSLFSIDTKKSSEQVIEDTLQKVTKDKWFEKWINNFALNLEEIWIGKSTKILKNSRNQSESSAIVIGRGPSLSKHNHLKLLADSNYSGTIICTDGILIQALKSGVTPDKFPNFFVVTIDPQDVQEKFYDDEIVCKYGSKIKALFSTTISPNVIKQAKNCGLEIFWFHNLMDFDNDNISLNSIIGKIVRSKNHHDGLPAIQTGGNVGTSSWVLSWSILNCSPISLIGIDHGYLIDTPWKEITDDEKLISNPNFEDDELFKQAYPIGYNPDFDCKYKQTPQFQYYSNAFKEFIPKSPSWVKTINSTEGGAIHGKNIEGISLKNFLVREK